MKEKPDPNQKWEELKSRLEYFKVQTQKIAHETVQDVKYRAVVSKDKHEQASLFAEAFTGEAMNFLNENTTGKLKPVQPTNDQLRLFYFLLNSIADESVMLESTQGRIRENTKRPYLLKKYRARYPLQETSDPISTAEFMDQKKRLARCTMGGQ